MNEGPERVVTTVYDTDCPDPDEGPFHFWEVDGPNSVSCSNCWADGVVVQTTEPERDDD
jgi:hypothetical protein